MIKHIVLVKMKDPTEENVTLLSNIMLSVKDHIEFIKDAKIQRDFMQTPVSFDLMLIIEMESQDNLIQFISHPYHTDYMQKESKLYVKELRLIDIVE